MKPRLRLSIGVCLLVSFLILVSWLRISNIRPFSVTIPLSHAKLPVTPDVLFSSTVADRAIQEAETRIRRVPEHSDSYISLANAYMQKSRESADPDYYLRAETAVRRALALQPDSQLGLRTLAWVQTGKHEFRAALTTAERLLVQSPDDPLVYGLLGDAAVELGEYQRAADAFEKMADLRPGMSSYSRLSYVRELFGDMPGATELMTLAVKAGNPRDPEPLAWSLVQLGNLYFHRGQQHEAETAYQTALTVFPHHYHALAALARVRAAQHTYSEAITLYRQATAAVPAPDTIAEFGDLLAFMGRHEEAEKQYAFVEYIEGVGAKKNETYSRQLALFYADHERKLDEAITLAEAEHAQRSDIYTYDTLAWVYYKAGRLNDAWQAMLRALRLGTKDASLFFHAGMICHGLGKYREAQSYLQQALQTNPYFHLQHAAQAKDTLTTLAKKSRQYD